MATKQKQETNTVTVIDGKDLVLGRMGSLVAKRLLLGESITLVNCNEIVILGKKKYLVERFKNKLANKVVKQGPYYSRSPADIVKRSLRNMLPYKNQRGADAYKRLRCFNSVPASLANDKFEDLTQAKLDEASVFYFTRVEELCRKLGYTKEK